jgi:hypothetical protein
MQLGTKNGTVRIFVSAMCGTAILAVFFTLWKPVPPIGTKFLTSPQKYIILPAVDPPNGPD